MNGRIRDAFRDWGEGYRSVGVLITGAFSRCQAFWVDVGGEDFGRRRSTQRLRIFLPEGQTEEQTLAILREAGQRHRVSVELLHGCADTEWYELIHLAEHGRRWGKEQDGEQQGNV